jgi:RHS repeat-associated protein
MFDQWSRARARMVVGWGLLASLLVATSIAQAHDFGGPSSGGPPDAPPPPPPCDSERPCQCPAPGRSGSPISYLNGSESITVTDLMVRGDFPIALDRKYDSQSNFDSPLGYGWSFTNDRRLYEYPDGAVVLRYGCGTRDKFVYSGGAYVTPPGGVLGNLVENADGSFVLSYNDGSRDYFDSQGRLTAVENHEGKRHEYTYDSRGKLPLTGTSKAAVDAAAPMVVALNYRLTQIAERAADGALTGRSVSFQYDETTGRLTTVTADDGRTVTYQHDDTAGLTKGNLIGVNGLDGVVATYGYTDPLDAHNLTSIVAATGRTAVVNTYDSQDRVIRQQEGTRKIEFNYQVPLTRTVVTVTIADKDGLNPQLAVSTYEFETSGRITKAIDPLGHETRYTYDSNRAMTRKEVWQKDGATLSLLQTTNWTYDSAGRKASEWVRLDSGEIVTQSWTYDHDWMASEQVVSSLAPGKVFRTEYTFFYGSDGRPTNIASSKRRLDDGSFLTTSYTYDGRNRLLTTTLPDGVKQVQTYTGDHVTQIAYEVNGAQIGSARQLFEYDSEGNRTKSWDARGNLTQYEYDDSGRLRVVTNPLGEQTLYTYTQDLLTQVEIGRTTADGEGQVRQHVYDSRGRLVEVKRKDDAGVFQTLQTLEYDSESRTVGTIDALGRRTGSTFDLMGRLTATTDPAGNTTTFGYDAVENRTRSTDALGREVRYEFDDLNRQVAMVELGITPSARTEYAYDAAGNRTLVRDAKGNETLYTYDSLSRRTATAQPLGQQVQMHYDSRDRVDYSINGRGQKIEYDYETWGPVSSERHYSSAAGTTPLRTIGYAYDLDGNPLSIGDSAVASGPSRTVTYDALSRVYDETVKYLPGGDRVLQHRYDRYGNRKEITLQDGTAVSATYVYDKRNRLVTANLNGAALTIGSYANDDRQSVSLPGGVTRTYQYDANGPVNSISVAGASTLAQFAFGYDDVLNLETLTAPEGGYQYEYDGLNRLTDATNPASVGLATTESYIYDAVGNREDPANASLYQYDGNNRVLASPGRTYTFDADGNTATRSDGATLTHDVRNRLIQFASGGTTATYLYDAEGRRIRKIVNGVATWYLWDGQQLLAEFDASGAVRQRYAYLPGDYSPAKIDDASGWYFVHEDHLQTPRIATGASGQVVWRARYESFGNAVVENDPDGNGSAVTLNSRFPGQYEDAESGLYYNYFRDYDPALGRYVQSDPIGLEGGINTYAYAMLNPTTLTDPAGLNPGAAGAAAVGGIAYCMRIPACRAAVAAAIKACKDVRCKFERHKAHHYFPPPLDGYCEHYSLTCWIKNGPRLFRAQWPFPGRCSKKRPPDWLP